MSIWFKREKKLIFALVKWLVSKPTFWEVGPLKKVSTPYGLCQNMEGNHKWKVSNAFLHSTYLATTTKLLTRKNKTDE